MKGKQLIDMVMIRLHPELKYHIIDDIGYEMGLFYNVVLDNVYLRYDRHTLQPIIKCWDVKEPSEINLDMVKSDLRNIAGLVVYVNILNLYNENEKRIDKFDNE